MQIPVIAVAIAAIQALALLAFGQPAICACGHVSLWHGSISSPENSQQLSDWYTFSHVVHGVLFYAALAWLAPGWPIGLRLVVALALEAGWEIVENTPFLVERYRQQALALGYAGDSIVNSLSDTLAAAVGFGLAAMLPRNASVALVIGLEAFTAFMVRDNLALNTLQLLYPVPAIQRWQSGG